MGTLNNQNFSPVKPREPEPESCQLRLVGRVSTVALVEAVLAVFRAVADLVFREAVLVQAGEQTRCHVALPGWRDCDRRCIF